MLPLYRKNYNMKNLTLFLFLIFSAFGSAQNAKQKLENSQGQDLNVPSPPKTTFPAQYPKGNRKFLKEVEMNLELTVLKDLPKNLKTKIILKIDSKGNVLNISTFGSDEIFNSEVKKAAEKTTDLIKWIPGKNQKGDNVIDIVNLPFKFSVK